jgi:hypothetical protein
MRRGRAGNPAGLRLLTWCGRFAGAGLDHTRDKTRGLGRIMGRTEHFAVTRIDAGRLCYGQPRFRWVRKSQAKTAKASRRSMAASPGSLPLTGERTVPGIPAENYWLVST